MFDVYRSATTLKPLTGGVNWLSSNSGSCLGVGFIMQRVNSRVLKLMCRKQEKWASVGIWLTLTRAKLCWLGDWVRASQKMAGPVSRQSAHVPVHDGKHLRWARGHQNWITEQWRTLWWIVFPSHCVEGWLRVHRSPGGEMAAECNTGRR